MKPDLRADYKIRLYTGPQNPFFEVSKFVRKNRREPWALSLLAQTYTQDNLDAKTALYSEALRCAHKEEFTLTALKEFASILAEQNSFDEASMCVKRAVKCYTDNGWVINKDLEFLLNQPWYEADVDISLLQPFIEKHAESAADYIIGERKQVLAIVIKLHKSGKGFDAYINKNESPSIRLKLFKSKKMPSIGEYISITLSSEDGDVIEAKHSSAGEVDGVKHVTGTLNITPKGFGFIVDDIVDDVFVPPDLITTDMDGRKVNALTVLSLDKKKNKYGMKAVSVDILAEPS